MDHVAEPSPCTLAKLSPVSLSVGTQLSAVTRKQAIDPVSFTTETFCSEEVPESIDTGVVHFTDEHIPVAEDIARETVR